MRWGHDFVRVLSIEIYFALTSVHIVFDDVTEFVGQMTVLVIRNGRSALKKYEFKNNIKH
jgi:hypothetical protein